MTVTKASPPRYELKFVADAEAFEEIRHWVHRQPEGFVQPYQPRWVNSVYLDTATLDTYAQNLAGGNDRRKVRYRWYGMVEPVTSGQFEVKVKHNRLGWKRSYPLPNPRTPITSWGALSAWLHAELPPDGRQWLSSHPFPSSITRYHRRYFATRDGSLRMTLDQRLRLFDQRHARHLNFTRALPTPAMMVMEVKFDRRHEESGRTLLERIPLRATRFSKYVCGVSRSILV